jgi:hypothetical protein
MKRTRIFFVAGVALIFTGGLLMGIMQTSWAWKITLSLAAFIIGSLVALANAKRPGRGGFIYQEEMEPGVYYLVNDSHFAVLSNVRGEEMLYSLRKPPPEGVVTFRAVKQEGEIILEPVDEEGEKIRDSINDNPDGE